MDNGKAGFAPIANAPIHGDDGFVAHSLEVFRGQGGSKAAAAVEDDLRAQIGNDALDVALQNALAEVDRLRQMARGVFTLFTDVYQEERFLVIEARFDVIDGLPSTGVLRPSSR